MSQYPSIKVRDLKPAQRSALRAILRYIRSSNAYTKCTSVRYELRDVGPFISVVTNTRRSDCERYSPRQIICTEHGHFFIGKRGGIKVATYNKGISDESKRHVARMLRCSVA